VALALALAPFSPVGAVVAAGLGNALFHVGAGAHVLRVSGAGAGPLGLFVGPGAVGLALGILSGQSDLPVRIPLLLGLAAGAIGVACLVERDCGDLRDIGGRGLSPALVVALGLVLLTVVSRALLGDTLAVVARERSTALVVGLAVAACIGKGMGGFLGDRLGWTTLVLAALLVAVPLLILAPRAPLATLGAGLLVQSTMPLTLKAVHNAMPHRPGFAFGVVSTVVLLGSFPGLARVTLLTSPVLMGAAAVVSAAALVVGLHVMRKQGLQAGFPRA
jgi:MFS transporter, FSR family, fosmidomycin resistance protein